MCSSQSGPRHPLQRGNPSDPRVPAYYHLRISKGLLASSSQSTKTRKVAQARFFWPRFLGWGMSSVSEGVLADSLTEMLVGFCARHDWRRGLAVLQRRKRGRGRKPRWKIAHKCLHGWVPEAVKAEGIHLSHRLGHRPFLNTHAVGGHKYSGAIFTQQAMHKDFLLRVGKQGKELRHFFVSRSREPRDRDVHKSQAQFFGLLSFPFQL